MAWAAGCLFPSLGDLSGDASTDGNFSDVASDAGDANVAVDAGDAALDAKIDSGPWCNTNTPEGGVCFDYDEPDASGVNITLNVCSDTPSCSNSFGIAPDTNPTSPPDALVLVIPAIHQYPSYAELQDRYTWTKPFETATIAFDMRIETSNATGEIGALEWGTVIYGFGLNGTGMTVQTSDYAPDSGAPNPTYNVQAAPIDFTKWHRYVLTVSSSEKTVVMTLDGATAINDTTRSEPLSGGLTFEWGVSYFSGLTTTPTKFHYDNVVLSTSVP